MSNSDWAVRAFVGVLKPLRDFDDLLAALRGGVGYSLSRDVPDNDCNPDGHLWTVRLDDGREMKICDRSDMGWKVIYALR